MSRKIEIIIEVAKWEGVRLASREAKILLKMGPEGSAYGTTRGMIWRSVFPNLKETTVGSYLQNLTQIGLIYSEKKPGYGSVLRFLTSKGQGIVRRALERFNSTRTLKEHVEGMKEALDEIPKCMEKHGEALAREAFLEYAPGVVEGFSKLSDTLCLVCKKNQGDLVELKATEEDRHYLPSVDPILSADLESVNSDYHSWCSVCDHIRPSGKCPECLTIQRNFRIIEALTLYAFQTLSVRKEEDQRDRELEALIKEGESLLKMGPRVQMKDETLASIEVEDRERK